MFSARKPLLILLLILISAPAWSQTVRSLLRRANDQYALKAYTQAIDTYKQVLERKADEVEALANIADCYWNINEMEEAADYYARLIRQRSVEPKYLLAFAHVLRSLGRYDEAKNYYTQYARTDPTIGNHFVQTCDFARMQQAQLTEFSVSEERVNSAAADFGPVFYGDQVVFASSRTDVQRPASGWDGISRSMLFLSRMGVDGYLQPAALLKIDARNIGEGPASFSSDGRFVAYTRNNFVSGVRQIPGTGAELNIFIAEVNTDGSWINERPFPHNTGGKTGYPCFTADGNALFFASDRPEGMGGYDLYISYREGNTWTRPINLGPVVNTPGNELSPYFDGTNLYFSSDWHAGFGGMDVFLAEQGDGRWAKVSNVGQPINSSRDDYGFVFDAFRNLGFVVSNRKGGRGAEDIYRVGKASENLILRVVSASDGTPIPGALIDLSACNPNAFRNLVMADAMGTFSFPIASNTNCEIVVTKDGFIENRLLLSGATLQGNRQVEVALTRRGEEYYGAVISSSTGQPLSGVMIAARNLNTGSTSRVYSDQRGQYMLGLMPNATYLITFSAQGYRELSRNLNTFDGYNRNILGTTPLVTFDSPGPFPPENPTPPTPGPGPTPSPDVKPGFSIQVAATSKAPDLSAYSSKVGSIGQVYSAFENGIYRVRIGPFATRDLAARQLAAAKRHYSGAFIVEEKGSVQQPSPQPQPQPTPQPQPQPQPQPTVGNFMIQLGAYSNPANFNASRVNIMGPIVDRKRGNLTLKLISGYRTIDEARRALPQAQQSGFPGAFIVEDRNGVLTRVN